ncbi:hypothetical protein MM817_02196 [Acidibacillus sp. S0AB]|uniref:MoaB/Mog domain-containing protein n=2 Tax=Sulfoacidibacillus ferrooxidans TaxID=2005001 RepID=A0A9X1VAH9_9BACL|nr:hypothetical protein [Sulfoacidibacillus ferrooxidans]
MGYLCEIMYDQDRGRDERKATDINEGRITMSTKRPEDFSVAILTISDRSFRGEREDRGGPAIAKELEFIGFHIDTQHIVPDEQVMIEQALRMFIAKRIALIVTTGGTGLGPRDVTPEATRNVITREVPGMAEEMRRKGLLQTKYSILSRSVCGICEESLIINLPGNPAGAVDSLQSISGTLVHALSVLTGPTFTHDA